MWHKSRKKHNFPPKVSTTSSNFQIWDQELSRTEQVHPLGLNPQLICKGWGCYETLIKVYTWDGTWQAVGVWGRPAWLCDWDRMVVKWPLKLGWPLVLNSNLQVTLASPKIYTHIQAFHNRLQTHTGPIHLFQTVWKAGEIISESVLSVVKRYSNFNKATFDSG